MSLISDYKIKKIEKKSNETLNFVKKFKNLTNFYVYLKSYGEIILLFNNIQNQNVRDKLCKLICDRYRKPMEPLKCKFEKTNYKVFSMLK